MAEIEKGKETSEFSLTRLLVIVGAVVGVGGGVAPETVVPESVKTVMVAAGFLLALVQTAVYTIGRVVRKNKAGEIVGLDLKALEELVEKLKKAAPLLLVSLVLCAGCITVQQYDEQTVQNVKATIEHEKDVYERLTAKLSEGDLLPFRVLHEAEMDRLVTWQRMEEAKKEKDE